jgi:hypothetical protein
MSMSRRGLDLMRPTGGLSSGSGGPLADQRISEARLPFSLLAYFLVKLRRVAIGLISLIHPRSMILDGAKGLLAIPGRL